MLALSLNTRLFLFFLRGFGLKDSSQEKNARSPGLLVSDNSKTSLFPLFNCFICHEPVEKKGYCVDCVTIAAFNDEVKR